MDKLQITENGGRYDVAGDLSHMHDVDDIMTQRFKNSEPHEKSWSISPNPPPFWALSLFFSHRSPPIA